MKFRATRDIDMILLIENRFSEFAPVFWNYIKAGGYKCGWKNSSEPHFYRFTEPKDPRYPKMIELFSRRPAFQPDVPTIHLTPLPVSDEISSLSAIMLNDDYYRFMLSGRRSINGVSILDTAYLIVFKAKAWLDLMQKKESGVHVNEKDLKKHQNDVFRLYAIVNQQSQIDLANPLSSDLKAFVDAMKMKELPLNHLGLEEFTKEEILSGLQRIFQMSVIRYCR